MKRNLFQISLKTETRKNSCWPGADTCFSRKRIFGLPLNRAEILFHRYPNLEKAYKLSRSLTRIYQTSETKGVAFTKLVHWYNEEGHAGLKSFVTVCRTIQFNILNENKHSNASADSFHAEIKASGFNSEDYPVSSSFFLNYLKSMPKIQNSPDSKTEPNHLSFKRRDRK